MIPIATILIPVKNGAEFIDECLKSCLNQNTSYSYEILVINDHSTDDTSLVLRDYIHKYKNFRTLDSDYFGVGNALKFGLSFINTKYVIRMDSDDVMYPQRLQEQISFMESNPDYSLYGSQIEIFPLTDITVPNTYPIENLDARRGMLIGNPFADPSTIIRTDSLRKIQIEKLGNLDGAEQYALWIALSHLGKVGNSPNVLLRYRKHPNQFTQKRNSDVIKATLKVQLLWVTNKLFRSESKKYNYTQGEKLKILLGCFEFIAHLLLARLRISNEN